MISIALEESWAVVPGPKLALNGSLGFYAETQI